MRSIKRVTALMVMVTWVTLASVAAAQTLVQGTLVDLQVGSGNTIDHWSFTVDATATVSFDLLAYENPQDVTEGGPAGVDVDVNEDQEIAYFDPKIYIFRGVEGSLEVGDAIFANDDDEDFAGLADGSLIVDSEESFDSYLEVELQSGSYVLTVGTFNSAFEDDFVLIIPAEAQAHIDGGLDAGPFPTLFGPSGAASDHGDYQVTFGAGITVATPAETLVQGTLVELEPGAGNSIDHWSFTIQRTATVTFDLLSYENPADVTEGGAAGTDVDLNDDQEIAYFDPKIYIFQGADGSLAVGDAIFVNDDDDASAGLADGSLIVDGEEPFDSYLEVELLSGSYVLTVGTWNFALEDDSDLIIEAEAQAHIDGSLNAGPFPTLFGPNGASSDHGDYQVTFGEGISVPEAGAPMMNIAALLSVVAAALRRKKSASRRCDLEREG